MPLTNAWILARQQDVPETSEAGEETPLAEPPPEEQPQKLPWNSATKDQLVALPGIGAVSAEAIINSRPHVSIEDAIAKAGLSRLSAEDAQAIAEQVTFE